jgi:hypothetical protein
MTFFPRLPQVVDGRNKCPFIVMAGLVPAIHDLTCFT